MTAPHTLTAVEVLLGADPGVPDDMRTAVIRVLRTGKGTANLGMLKDYEAARVLGLSRSGFHKWLTEGKLQLKVYRFGVRRCTRYAPDEVEAERLRLMREVA